jgi:hypothetical protein
LVPRIRPRLAAAGGADVIDEHADAREEMRKADEAALLQKIFGI